MRLIDRYIVGKIVPALLAAVVISFVVVAAPDRTWNACLSPDLLARAQTFLLPPCQSCPIRHMASC